MTAPMTAMPNPADVDDASAPLCSRPADGVLIDADGIRTSVTWQLPEEVAIAIQINSAPYTVMMATPANLADFGIGFVLAEGIVRQPSDVDMGLILGIAFPAFRGGLLRWADTLGLPKVVEKLQSYEKLGPRFQPTEEIRKLVAAGKGFYAT